MLKTILLNIEFIKSLYNSKSELIIILKNYQLEMYAWLLANIFISYITTYWLSWFTHDVYHSKELLNTAYVIFVNAFLFSLLPDLSYKNKEKQKTDNNEQETESIDSSNVNSIPILIKYLNITSIAIAVLIPFLLYKNLSYNINIIFTIILLVFSFIHFTLQSYCNKHDKLYDPNRDNIFLNNNGISNENSHISSSGRAF